MDGTATWGIAQTMYTGLARIHPAITITVGIGSLAADILPNLDEMAFSFRRRNRQCL